MPKSVVKIKNPPMREGLSRIPFNRADLVGSELAYIEQSIESGIICGEGPYVKKCQEFLENHLGHDSRVFMTPSCTAALEMVSLLLGLKQGDEVLMPSFTFVSTASAVALSGARPVFVDVEEETLNIDVSDIPRAISDRTKAMTVVHYGGLPCKMEALQEISRKNNLVLIEDAAHALGSSYGGRAMGSFGTFSTFSFHETKNVTCGEGGALVVRGDSSLVEQAQIIQDKGTNRRAFQRGDAAFYSWVGLGSSYVMSDILAAFLYAQLEKLDFVTKKRKEAKAIYRQILQPLMERGDLKFQIEAPNSDSSAHLFYVLLDSKETRERLRLYLMDRGISAVFHYQPLHKSSYVEARWGKQPELPVTESIADRLLRLPLYNWISRDEVEEVVLEINKFFTSSIK